MAGSSVRLTMVNFGCIARRTRAFATPFRNYLPSRVAKTELQALQTPGKSGFMLHNARIMHTSVVTNTEKSRKENAAQEGSENKLTLKERLKSVVQEYGTTAIVFHVSISLTSLGLCYAAVKSWKTHLSYAMAYSHLGLVLSDHIYCLRHGKREHDSSRRLLMTFGDWQFFFPFPAALVVGLLSLICILNCLFLGLQFDTDVVYHCFLVSGIDVQATLQKIGVSPKVSDSSVATGASTFVVAYACHKVFAPLRMLMTITCTPLIVIKLRRMGFMKEPVKQ